MKRHTRNLALGLAAVLLFYSALPAAAAALPGADGSADVSLHVDSTQTVEVLPGETVN